MGTNRLRSNFFFIIVILAALVLGFLGSRWYLRQQLDTKAQVDSDVLLEKIEAVAKLVTVEGYFSEIYDYKDYWGYDIGLFRKKALLRVKAKVSVGYDLSRMKVESRPEERIIILSGLPKPDIISIDHQIDYYDISEGAFNPFTEADYSRLNHDAKAFIENKARESDLLKAAEEQGNQVFEMMRFMVESAGWTLAYQPGAGEKVPESLKN